MIKIKIPILHNNIQFIIIYKLIIKKCGNTPNFINILCDLN